MFYIQELISKWYISKSNRVYRWSYTCIA